MKRWQQTIKYAHRLWHAPRYQKSQVEQNATQVRYCKRMYAFYLEQFQS